MELKASLIRRLKHARKQSESLLADFQTPGQWTHQVYPGANHALWFAGHMATIDNFFIAAIDPSKKRDLGEFPQKFGIGSRPTDRFEDYPPPAEVLAVMRERREVLLGLLEGMFVEDFSHPTQPGTPKFLPDFAAVFEGAAWHEAMHSGQVTVTRRALGHSPMRDAIV